LEGDLSRANADLATVNKGLVSINSELAQLLPTVATALNDLAVKDWSVYISTPGGSASGDVVGAVNSRL
jgi:hypothetical protein